YAYPDGLVPGTTYYWRIDEVESDGVTKHKGDVWSFFISPKKAYDPSPTDGAGLIETDVTLSFSPGFGVKLHHMYFGENFADVEAGTPDTYKGPLAVTSFIPGTLEFNKNYYWRIDEFDGVNTHKGDVWSFKTTQPGLGSIVLDIWDNIAGGQQILCYGHLGGRHRRRSLHCGLAGSGHRKTNDCFRRLSIAL
ncbi:hypothetical protein ACFL5F_08335, partial [Planctomycetota bacterium]